MADEFSLMDGKFHAVWNPGSAMLVFRRNGEQLSTAKVETLVIERQRAQGLRQGPRLGLVLRSSGSRPSSAPPQSGRALVGIAGDLSLEAEG